MPRGQRKKLGLGFKVLGFRGLGFRGLGLRVPFWSKVLERFYKG